MRILWYNWRDIKNPDAGGAEVFLHEVMTRLVDRGFQNTLFTSKFPECKSTEKVNGIEIIRDGGKYSVYEKAKKYYHKNSENYDIVIDSINTKPFLTPKFVRNKPILAIFYQLAREFWFYETSFPINIIGYYFLERRWLSYYVNVPTITISQSSKKDLLDIGFKTVFIVPIGVNITPLESLSEKEKVPTIIFVGRLKKAKRPDHALEAFSIVKKVIPEARMWIVGDGYMRKDLEKLDGKDVIFYGRVSNERKYTLLSKAHLSIVPGIREGWGLSVTESNAMGTPAVAYNVPGLRDSVIHAKTGILSNENSPQSLARSAISLLQEKDLLDQYSINALASSRKFRWVNTANEFEMIIKNVVENFSL